ncbi:TOBE domain-containing protein, partial [Halorubrum sp. SD626R]
IRPEDLSVDASADASGGDAAGDHAFDATVTVVEPMGDENVVHLSLADGPELVATVNGLRRIESGTDVIVSIPENAIHVFDGDSGDALHNRSLDDAELDDARV